MKGTQLGDFEELVLLTIGSLKDEAYGVTIKLDIEARAGRVPSIGALHSSLHRLEEKGFIKSREGGSTQVRGGRRKRFYTITAHGRRALTESHNLRTSLFRLIPGIQLNTK